MFFSKEEFAELGGAVSGIFAVNNSGNATTEFLLAVASGWIFVVFGEDLLELFRGDEGVHLEEAIKVIVGLVEPELIEIKDGSLGAIEPDGVAFGLAKLATCNLIDYEWARVSIGLGILEALDEMNARGTVAILVGTAELKIDIVGAEEVKEIVALNEGVAELGIRDT